MQPSVATARSATPDRSELVVWAAVGTAVVGATKTVGAVWTAADSLGKARRKVRPAVASLMSDRLGFVGVPGDKEASWQLLRQKEFRRFFVGSLISNFGTWLQNTAQMLLAYQLRHSLFLVGLVTCVQFASPLLLGPWAGVVASRFGSRKTLLVTQLLSMMVTIVLAVLQFSHVLGELSLLGGAFATGLMFTFALPAQSVFIPRLVRSADETKAAMAMNSVSYNAGRALAPALGVVIVTTIGFGWAFIFNAVTFGVFMLVLLALRPGAAVAETVRSRVRDGFRIAWTERRILLLLLMVSTITFADDPILVLGPGVAHQAHVPAVWSGYFLSALGLGSVVGSLLPRNKVASGRRAAVALAFLGVSINVFVLVPDSWVGTTAAFAAGFGGLVAGSAAQALLIGLAGPERALRVMGLWTVAWAGSKPIASIIDGALPSLVGVRATGAILAVPSLLPLLILVFCPALVGRLMNARKPANSGEATAVHTNPREIKIAA